jgi:hypothetical protein
MGAMEQTKRQAHQVSGISNIAYDLITILENKLQGVGALQQYKQDAQEQGDQPVLQLLNELERRASEDISRLRPLVAERLR